MLEAFVEFMQPHMQGELFVLWMFPFVLFFIFLGLHVAFSLMLTALVFGYLLFGDAVGHMMTNRMWEVSNNYALASIPLFVIMGAMMEASGIAERLYKAMVQFTKGINGGLAVGTTIMCTVFAATTGVLGAAAVLIGLLAIPPMLKYKYNPGFVCGTVCAGASLGTIIPPSIVIVVFGPVAGLSIGKLLSACIVPGLILPVLYIIYQIIRCTVRPQDGPPLARGEMEISRREKIHLFLTSMLPAIGLMFAVVGTILMGWASPTEAAALGAFGSIILAASYGRLSWAAIYRSCITTLKVTSMAAMILVGGSMYTGVFLSLGGQQATEAILAIMQLSPNQTLLLFLFVAFLMGFTLDWVSVLLIFVPIFTPLIAKLGYDPIWFGTLFIMVLQTSFLSPPMAPAIFYLKPIVPPEIKLQNMMTGVMPYVLLQMIGLMLVWYFPPLATWLPSLM